MGAEIEGDRLGLGTNLFSAKETLSEKEGVTAEYNKMLKKSKLMEKLSDIDEEEYRRKEEEKERRPQLVRKDFQQAFQRNLLGRRYEVIM